MAQPIRQAITATGIATPQMLDFFQSPFNVTIGVDVSNAVGATFSLQYTLSDFVGLLVPGTVITPLWRQDATIIAGSTTSLVTNYIIPIFGVRLNVTGLTSGTIYLEILQGMNGQH
jgi:hypothetical protein